MPPADTARRPVRRYRRQLRSRIILSFVLLGFGLTALFAYAVDKVRNQVEDKLVVDLMNRNIDLYAQQFARDPANPSLPVDQMRAFATGVPSVLSTWPWTSQGGGNCTLICAN